jgi:two-component system, cell cycle sensor histidine kinase and response regulator CckA
MNSEEHVINTTKNQIKEKNKKDIITILVVDDNEVVRETACEILKEFGFIVKSAENAIDALEFIKEDHNNNINLLLTDINMPGMNGFKLGQKVLKKVPEFKILYMTGYADCGHEISFNISGNLINKPFTIGNLLNKINEVLNS